MRITPARILIAVFLVILLAVGVYFLPPVHSRLAWRLEAARAKVASILHPPDEAIFQPAEQRMLETIVAQTMQAYQAATPPPIPTATRTSLPRPTSTPTPSPVPLPSTVMLDGVRYEHQHGRNNYCGPANFSMALTFWGWDGDRDVIGQALMPGNNIRNGRAGDHDKNVMPYELQDYIAANVPGITSIIRYGGNIDVLRQLVAAGFPVLVEKGIYELDKNATYSWMGHYAFVTGYDDLKQEIIYQDTYQPSGAPPGKNRRLSFEEFIDGWRSFNYVFIVVHPYYREGEVLSLLGDWADEGWATRKALAMAENATHVMLGTNEYFAWFNKGTSHAALFEYAEAAIAYDKAFQLYADLGDEVKMRPYRMMWYQTGPYKAYFYTSRYADVIELANVTLQTPLNGPVLEESLYWRGKAQAAQGDIDAAIADYRAALRLHPGWGPAVQALQDLGIQP